MSCLLGLRFGSRYVSTKRKCVFFCIIGLKSDPSENRLIVPRFSIILLNIKCSVRTHFAFFVLAVCLVAPFFDVIVRGIKSMILKIGSNICFSAPITFRESIKKIQPIPMAREK